MINTKRPNTNDYTQVGFIEAKDGQGNYQNIDHIYDSEGNIVFQQGYLNEYDGADDFSIPAIGKPLIDYTIYGNTFQDGTPTPDTPVIPQGTGERTGNLFDISQVVTNTQVINQGSSLKVMIPSTTTGVTAAAPNTLQDYCPTLNIGDEATLSFETTSSTKYIYLLGENITWPSGQSKTITATMLSSVVIWYASGIDTEAIISNIMLNLGPTALPYEPYGIKIPILSANTTTPVYLGEVETTRKIKKLVLTGEENWTEYGSGTRRFFYTSVSPTAYNDTTLVISTHFPLAVSTQPYGVTIVNSGTSLRIYDRNTAWADVTTLKTWLAQQYAAGTPVTVWYVLATPTTGIVNEPLMRIGDYADSVDFSQAGVEIPTLKRPNTTVIDITTSLPPSEVYAKYRGSKTQKYDLFLAANGDSFEAKNGQSLYIGDDA